MHVGMQRTIESQPPNFTAPEVSDPLPFDPHALIEQVLQDCAECRALRALGTVPLVDPADELFAPHDLERTVRR
jgi:hypothetical protein